MNRQWMRQQLEAFDNITMELAKTMRLDQPMGPREFNKLIVDNDRRRQLYRAEPTITRILLRLDPELAREFNLDQLGFSFKFRDQIQRALGILNDMDEWAANLEPDAPTLPADQFHQWVWQAARTFWDSKHYRAAVDAAANAINAHTQDKVGRRDIADTDLMNQIFTEKPKSGQTYLQLPGDLNDQTIKSRNRALRPFAEGCFAGIRNPATHEHGPDWDEHKALEQLAALSVLARWIDECEVKQAP